MHGSANSMSNIMDNDRLLVYQLLYVGKLNIDLLILFIIVRILQVPSFRYTFG
jgi:hypothetical protein